MSRQASIGWLRFAAWAVALAVLGGALWYYNASEPVMAETPDAEEATLSEDDTAVGSQVGMRCPDFTVPLYGEGNFTLADVRGKVVVINFWATWCTPCCNELPYFQQLLETYGDDVAVVAIHSSLITDDVEAYLAKQSYVYTMPFALDETGEVMTALGGSTMLPMTVVLDRDGIVTYNQVGSVTYEKLVSLVSPLI